jgi:hypothetical protein
VPRHHVRGHYVRGHYRNGHWVGGHYRRDHLRTSSGRATRPRGGPPNFVLFMFGVMVLCLVGQFVESTDSSGPVASRAGTAVESSVDGPGIRVPAVDGSDDLCLRERQAYYRWRDHHQSVMAAGLMPSRPELENLRTEAGSYGEAVPSARGQDAAVLTVAILYYRDAILIAMSEYRDDSALDRIVAAAADIDGRHNTFAESCES